MSKPIAARSGPDPALSAVLRRLREERGISKEMLAHNAGMTTGAYGRIEASISSPGWRNFRRLAEALDVTISELARAIEVEERG